MTASQSGALRTWAPPLVLALALRGLWTLFVHPEPIADFAFYYTRAAEMAQGLGYQYQGHPTAFFPVGTSLILAGPFKWFGPSLGLALLLSWLAWGFAVVMTYQLAALLSNTSAARLAAVLVAVHPDLIAFSSLVASENFFIPLLLGSLYLLCRSLLDDQPRWAWVAGAGVLFGAALLVRSTVLILLPMLPLLLLWSGRRTPIKAAVRATLFVVCAIGVLAPWVMRNATVMGKPVLTTNGGISLWWGNNPNASGGFPLTIQPPTQDLSSIDAELANNARFSQAAFQFMFEHTGRWLSLVPGKFSYLFGALSQDIGFSLRYRYAGGVWAIEGHPRLGDPQRAAEAEYVPRALGAVESRLVGLYYHVSGGALGQLWQRLPWVVGSIGFLLMLVRPTDRRLGVVAVALVPLAWVLFHITLGNGQSRYLLSVAPLMFIGGSDLLVRLAARKRQPPAPNGAPTA